MYFTEKRIGRILQEVQKSIYSHTRPVNTFLMKKGVAENGGDVDADTGDWVPYNRGDKWNGYMEHCRFTTDIIIPEAFSEKDVVLEIVTGRESYWEPINPQMLAFVNGELVHALDINHRFINIAKNARKGEKYNVTLYVYSGRANENEPPIDLTVNMHRVNREVEALYYNIHVPHEAVKIAAENSKEKTDILFHLNEAINLLDLRQPLSDKFFNSVNAANAYLETEFYEKCCGKSDFTVNTIGHSHLDVAWGWTVSETREKAVRTFANMLNLMDNYEEFMFIASQPVLYKFVKEGYPELYEKVKRRIKEGRWEAEGAMWLEADCNLSSGESLVRQILYGKRFFKEEFGADSKVLWLPDVFGYSAALPQILRKSGVDYFMTTKIGWNEYNKLPMQSFIWEGIDGSTVLTHLLSGYGHAVLAREYKDVYSNYPERDINDQALFAYGFSDGGGGATPEMVEKQRRFAKGIPGLPKSRHGKVIDFFKHLENNITEHPKLPRWVGELYLEYHRGTYTSMARNKRNNRYSELLYQDVELFLIMADALCGTDIYSGNKSYIKDNWELILLNQFHDILPGSSIKEVYEDSDVDYSAIKEAGNKLLDKAFDTILSNMDISRNSIAVFNQFSRERCDIAKISLPDFDPAKGITIFAADGSTCDSQITEEGILFHADNVPAKGYAIFAYDTPANPGISSTPTAEIINQQEIKTDFYHVKLDENGDMTSIYDRMNNRELLKTSKVGNQFQAFEDIPLAFSAWDINLYYQEKMWLMDETKSISVIENGPVRASIRIVKTFCNSVITQYIRFYKKLNRIDFVTDVDWKEKQVLLKVAFPLDIHTNTATYEIQYGNAERPTHQNTSWDKAKFEVCGQRWADLSESGYGVSLLNDCKYGHDTIGGNLRLTLIKSSGGWPYPDADNEKHTFTYSLYPHAGDWKSAQTADMAYNLNSPMYTVPCSPNNGILPSSYSMFTVQNDNIMIETVKQSEDGNEIILRLYEYKNIRTNASFHCSLPIVKAVECNLLEEEMVSNTYALENGSISFTLMPYEIKTFKLYLNNNRYPKKEGI